MGDTTFREWRLTGQPNGGFPPYDVTVRDDKKGALLRILHAVRSGEYPWERAELTTREVRIQRTEWAPVEPCEITHAHTRHWCGNLSCRES